MKYNHIIVDFWGYYIIHIILIETLVGMLFLTLPMSISEPRLLHELSPAVLRSNKRSPNPKHTQKDMNHQAQKRDEPLNPKKREHGYKALGSRFVSPIFQEYHK